MVRCPKRVRDLYDRAGRSGESPSAGTGDRRRPPMLKEMAPRFLVECLREVYRGRQWFEQRPVGDAMEKLVRRDAAARELSELLSRREIEVVRGVAQGLRNRQIAERLGIAEGTIKLHLHTVYTKLGVDGRTALLAKLQQKSFS